MAVGKTHETCVFLWTFHQKKIEQLQNWTFHRRLVLKNLEVKRWILKETEDVTLVVLPLNILPVPFTRPGPRGKRARGFSGMAWVFRDSHPRSGTRLFDQARGNVGKLKKTREIFEKKKRVFFLDVE